MTAETQNPAIRGFLRSLNIVLKSARMYGMSHPQTSSLLDNSWKHLQAALTEKRNGMELGVSGNTLLVDGVALKGGPAERGLADLLSATDLVSLTFTTEVTLGAFGRMVQAFAESGSKIEGVAQDLKNILGGAAERGIRINESAFERTSRERPQAGAELFSRTPGTGEGFANDPNRILQLITPPGRLVAFPYAQPASGMEAHVDPVEVSQRVH